LVILLIIIQIFFRPRGISAAAILAFTLSGIMILLFLRYPLEKKWKIFYYSALVSILVNFYLNLIFYPEVLTYQSGTKVARYANQHFPEHDIRTLGVLPFTIHFYADNEVRDREIPGLKEELSKGEYLIFTSEPYLDSLRMLHIDFEVVKQFDHFHTTMVTGTFLNHKTRHESLRKHFLLKSKP
jgi:energy-coupling factor transporter transmembrane protein EcfT